MIKSPIVAVVLAAGAMAAAVAGTDERHVCGAPVTVIAGSSDVGDLGAATDALLAGIGGLALDHRGNLYISDSGHNRIRRVDALTKVITTVAGSGEIEDANSPRATERALVTPGPIAIDAQGRFLYTADVANLRIVRVDLQTARMEDLGSPPGGFGRDALRQPIFGQPIVVLAQGASLVAVDPATGKLWRYAGRRWTSLPSESAAFSGGLRDAVIDRDGNIFVSEFFAHRVLRIDGRTGKITTVAGTSEPGKAQSGAVASQASISLPDGLALDSEGQLYVAEAGNRRILRVNLQKDLLTVAYELTPGASGETPTPGAIRFDQSGELWIADVASNRVLRSKTRSKDWQPVAGGGSIGDGGPAVNARLAHPDRMAFGPNGNLYFSEPILNRVRVIDARTGLVRTFVGTGTPGYNGDKIWGTEAQLNYPTGLAANSQERLYIADTLNHRVRRVDLTNGMITTLAGTGKAANDGDGGLASKAALLNPRGLALDGNGNLFVTDAESPSMRVISLRAQSIQATTLDPHSFPSGSAGVFLGLAAWQRHIYLADALRDAIYAYEDGNLSLITGMDLKYPADVAVSREGDLFICDTLNNRILKSSNGKLETVIEHLARPRGVLADANGDVYVTDTLHNRIVKICSNAPPATPTASRGPF